MYKNILVLPDGMEISSGSGTDNAIKNIKSTQMVNSYEELTIGSACSNMVEVTLFTPGGDLNITAGDELTYYKVDAAGNRTKVGLFTVEQPTRPTANTMKIVGYDRVAKLDKDLTTWLESLTGWPYSVQDFAAKVYNACGVAYVSQDGLPNAGFSIRKWKKTGATGRQIMRWLGEIVCRYVYADPDGNIRFGWYKDSGKSYTPAGENYFFAGSLSCENFRVAPIDAVQIRLADTENGAVWPQVAADANSYIITGNPILNGYVNNDLVPYLEAISHELSHVTYTPCEVAVPTTMDVTAGDIVRITDKNGKTISIYIMSKVTSGQRDTISCTGSQRRDSSTAVNNKTEADKLADADLNAQAASNNAQNNAEEYTNGKVKELDESIDQEAVFNRLTNGGKAQGIYMIDDQLYINANYLKSGTIDANLVKVINLIADKLTSESGTSKLTIDAASMKMRGTSGTNCSLINFDDGTAYLYFTQFDANGSDMGRSQFGANRMTIGGTWIYPVVGFFAKDGKPQLQLAGDTAPKTLSWKDNGDGTFTLIGQ